jgi:hypothetical protein
MSPCPSSSPTTASPLPKRLSVSTRMRRCYAEALSRKPGYVGAVAFGRTGDPATDDFGDAKVIRKFGEVPKDLSPL